MICIIASINLHNRIFFRLMRANVSFFDNNPVGNEYQINFKVSNNYCNIISLYFCFSGRILNRFTKDVGIIDERLPFAAYDFNLVNMFIKQ